LTWCLWIRIDALNAGDEFMKIFSLILVMTLAACAYGDPHQNFLEYQARRIGRSIDTEILRRKPISDEVGLNGNGVVKYWYVWPRKEGEFRFNDGVCMEIYEYDQISRKILKTSFEGTRCVWNP
jgi:hypothetical protein